MQIVANGIGIEVDDQGLPGGEPLLLIMGLGMQLVGWPDELVQMLMSRGFRVVRLDNRDAGLERRQLCHRRFGPDREQRQLRVCPGSGQRDGADAGRHVDRHAAHLV